MQTTLRRVLPLLAALLVVGLVASGCGKSAAQKRKDFLGEANSTCKHFESLQNQVQFPISDPTAKNVTHVQRAQWGLAMNQIVNYGRQELRALGKLHAPKDLQDGYRQMMDKKSTAYDDLAQGADAAKRNRVSQIQPPIDAGRAALASAAELAKQLDLPDCL